MCIIMAAHEGGGIYIWILGLFKFNHELRSFSEVWLGPGPLNPHVNLMCGKFGPAVACVWLVVKYL